MLIGSGGGLHEPGAIVTSFGGHEKKDLVVAKQLVRAPTLEAAEPTLAIRDLKASYS